MQNYRLAWPIGKRWINFRRQKTYDKDSPGQSLLPLRGSTGRHKLQANKAGIGEKRNMPAGRTFAVLGKVEKVLFSHPRLKN